MKILFVVSKLYFSEPLGVMQLSAICKKARHETKLVSLMDHSIISALDSFNPDLICYSTMTSDEKLFINADVTVCNWLSTQGKIVPRIMGGPHPTFFPEVLKKLDLDAICQGDGDRAIVSILDRIESGSDFHHIPNVLVKNGGELVKEIINDLDSLPSLDRDILYESMPGLQKVGVRSFMSQRGCPYKCTYCFNHAYNKFFKGERRKLIRRRSVDNLIAEIQEVIEKFPTVRFIRFGDDVFVIKQDAWLEEFAEKYRRKIGIPFYCLIRANSLTEPVAKLLNRAGCHSVAMSIETGSPSIREVVLKRKMSDEMLIDSFELARKFKMKVYANTMLGLPGTTLEDDFNSFLFAKKARIAAPTFGIFQPFPRTELTQYALENGFLQANYDFNNTFSSQSPLSVYSQREKETQVNLARLATLFCFLPDCFIPLLQRLIRIKLTPLYSLIGTFVFSYLMSTKIFPGAYPRNPFFFLKNAYIAITYSLFADTSQSDVERPAKEKSL